MARKDCKKKRANQQERELGPQAMQCIDIYMVNGHNQKQAMLDAGYSAAYAKTGSFFGLPQVKKEVARRLAERQLANAVTAEKVDEAWKTIAFTPGVGSLLEINEDGTAWVDFSKLTAEQRFCIKSFGAETYVDSYEIDEDGNKKAVRVKKTKVEFYDRLAALQRWDKRLHLVKEAVEVSSGDDVMDLLMKGRARAAKKG